MLERLEGDLRKAAALRFGGVTEAVTDVGVVDPDLAEPTLRQAAAGHGQVPVAEGCAGGPGVAEDVQAGQLRREVGVVVDDVDAVGAVLAPLHVAMLEALDGDPGVQRRAVFAGAGEAVREHGLVPLADGQRVRLTPDGITEPKWAAKGT